MEIAPWQVHICAVRSDNNEVKKCADSLYEELLGSGIEVIYDDRAVSAGIMFADADLLGVPFRIIVSPRNLKENCCEIESRDKTFSIKVKADLVKEKIVELVATHK
jgi:prolyl-tRNA synthetase